MKKSSYLLSMCVMSIFANETVYLDTIETEGRQTNIVGEAVSASEGIVGQEEIALRPLLRTGEILELVPGMVVTQHSGTGKANQYFLRGFNLDHGSDFATYIDGMPINMRTHAHGQGYTDLNFIIPELVQTLTYKKGSYYADVGDFSGAGSAHFSTFNELKQGLSQITVGEDNYLRIIAMDSFKIDKSTLLIAVEGNQYDGPWSDINEDLNKKNAYIKYSTPLADGTLSLIAMAYDNTWNSADQIPSRAVQRGIIDELGSLDDTLGGESSRYSLSANWQNNNIQASFYMIDYSLDLWSNFTYYLDDEINGDQFKQVDDRIIYGGKFNYTTNNKYKNIYITNTFGSELRIDSIDEVGLYHTKNRDKLGTVRSDKVEERSLGVYWENKIDWTSNFRSVFGARYDYFDFDVQDKVGINTNGIDLSANSGKADDGIASLKGSLIYTLTREVETYISTGQGFHSNDARGTTIKVDPNDGSSVDAVDPLVRSFGYELGIRGFISDKINASLSLWALDIDSELLFVGDAGNTEASGKSERKGIELTTYYNFTSEWSIDVEYSYTDAKFSNAAIGQEHIPGAVEHVFQTGLNANFARGWFGSLRMRYFGPRPLTEDNSVRSDSSTLWNLRAGYKYNNWMFRADILNLTDSKDHDIDYYYQSRLASEASSVGTDDLHYHILEPRTIRISLAYSF